MEFQMRRTYSRRIYYGQKKAYKRFYARAALLVGIMLGVAASFILVSNYNRHEGIVINDDLPANAQNVQDASGEDALDAAIIDPRLILGSELPVIYGIDLEEIFVDERTEADSPQTDIFFDVLPDKIKIEILGFASDKPKKFFVNAKGPQILIYHTHTQEAYRQIKGQEYVEVGSWRTAQHDSSIVAVGSALEKRLEEHGYTVLHDTTNHEPPALNTAYTRSLKTMEKYKKEYSSINVFIDVHRDAYGNIAAGSKDFVLVNGEECARIMFVVGTGEQHTKKPNYESNYKLALAITNQMESIKKGFTRPIRVKTGRYNQHVSDMCLLIEVGHNANALQQAINTTRYIALALSKVLEPST